MADLLEFCSDLPVLSVPAGEVLIMEGEQPSRMLVLDPDSFLNDNPGAAVAVLRMTAMRLDGLTQYLVDVKQQFAGLTGHLGMVDQIRDSLVHHQSGPTRTGSVRDPEC